LLRLLLSFLGGIFSMLTLGLVMGAVAVGAVFWMYNRDLPSIEVLQQYTPRMISRVYSGEGQIIDEFAQERRLFTPSEEIPDLVKHAFVAAEDQNFYTHPGFDVGGMAAAVAAAVRTRGEEVRGASTITQQVAKNFLLSGDRSIERKIREIILADRIERALEKEDILELYLNEIDLGRRSFGVTAAAQTYFNKPLTELSAAEAAYLAALPKAPYSYDSVDKYDEAVERRNYVLGRMHEDGYIDDATWEEARESPLRTVQRGDFPSFREQLPRGTTSPTRSGGSCRAASARRSSRRAATRSARPWTPSCRWRRRTRSSALSRPSTGAWGSGTARWGRLPAEALGDEAAWRQALAAFEAPRDVTLDGPWYPAVVLEVGDAELRLGIEGEHTETPVVPRADIDWIPGSFADTFSRGDVVLVRKRLTRTAASALDAAAGARGAGRLHGDGREHRAACSPCRGGSATSRRSSTAPRRRGGSRARPSSPSSMRGARLGLHACDHRGGRAHRDRHAEGSGRRRTRRGSTTGPRRCARASRCRGTS
jgi:penicillin-binding protein 1A